MRLHTGVLAADLDDAFRVATKQTLMLATNEMIRALLEDAAEEIAKLHKTRPYGLTEAQPGVTCDCVYCVYHRSCGQAYQL